MLTDCQSCCFFTDSHMGKGCLARQLCVKEPYLHAPGCCRLYRSNKWTKDHEFDDIDDLIKLVRQANGLRFALFVVFDGISNSIEELIRSITGDWLKQFCKQIIVVDVTGEKDRDYTAINYIRKNDFEIPISIDCSIKREIDYKPEAIRRVTKMTTLPYFLVIPAGKIISNLYMLDDHLKNIDSRVVLWRFPVQIGRTLILPNEPYYGLYRSREYKKFVKRYDNQKDSYNRQSFLYELQYYEQQIDFSLSWHFNDCVAC